MGIIISIIVWLIWSWIIYELYTSPVFDDNGIEIKEQDITDELYSRSEGNTLVDNAWTCGCGQLNAAYNKLCGKCNMIKQDYSGMQ